MYRGKTTDNQVEVEVPTEQTKRTVFEMLPSKQIQRVQFQAHAEDNVSKQNAYQVNRCDHRDYKRIEAASGDESRDKLNKSNGGKFKSRMYSDEKHTVFVFLLVFMTMIRTNIDYNGKIVLQLSSFCNFRYRQLDFCINIGVFQP